MNGDKIVQAMCVIAAGVFALLLWSDIRDRAAAELPKLAPTKTETLKCVRVKEVGADAQIIYKCEVPK